MPTNEDFIDLFPHSQGLRRTGAVSLHEANDAFIRHHAARAARSARACEYCRRPHADSAGRSSCVGCGAPVPGSDRPATVQTSSYGARTFRF